jgi:hypothetical protein
MPTPACWRASTWARRKSASRGRNSRVTGKSKLLGGGVLEGHALEHLLEEDAFVGGVLVDEDECPRGSRRRGRVEGDAADDAEAEAVGDEGFRALLGDFLRARFLGEGEGGLEGEGFGFFFQL